MKNAPERLILNNLRNSYPDAKSVSTLQDDFKEEIAMVPSTIYTAINKLEEHHFIHKLDRRQKKKRVSDSDDYSELFGAVLSRGRPDYRTNLYVVEEVDNAIRLLSKHTDSKRRLPAYLLAPGYVEYDEEFTKVWNVLISKSLIDKDILHELSAGMLKFLRVILSIAMMNDEMRKIAPSIGNEGTHCVNCGINHEARNFFRASLLKLLDYIEISPEYIEFLKEKNVLDEEGYTLYKQANYYNTQHTKPYNRGKPGKNTRIKSSTVSRVMSLEQHTDTTNFLALKHDGSYIIGEIDNKLKPNDMKQDTLILIRDSQHQNDPSNLKKVSLTILQEDDESIPKRIDLPVTSIKNIRASGEFYHVDATIVDLKEKEYDEDSRNTVLGIIRLRDSTGEIDYTTNPYSRLYGTLNIGDRVDVIGVCYTPKSYSVSRGRREVTIHFHTPGVETIQVLEQ